MLHESKRSRDSSRLANEKYSEATELVEEYGKLVKEHKGTILDWKNMVNELAVHISRETASIMMAMDTLAFGKESVPDEFRNFWSNLLSKAAQKISIDIVFFEKKQIERMLEEQFKGNAYINTRESVIKGHLQCIDTLIKEGGDTVSITSSPYFALQLFIFESNEVAFFHFTNYLVMVNQEFIVLCHTMLD